MRTVRTVAELRQTLSASRRDGLTIGLVPTMGALHDGHVALIERARDQCDHVVVSLFVNPAQFDERADLERYPRREHDDARLAAAAGADVLFAPTVEEVYPRGFATTVQVTGIADRLEGAARGAEHFRGVATVVTKLLGMTQPDAAYFGQKDAQQIAVIRRLVADLNLAVRIEALATVREPDGLAMSSRNALLTTEQRARALALPAALAAAHRRAAGGERRADRLLGAAHEAMRPFNVQPEYLALVDPDTFDALDTLTGEALLTLAARIGEIRLIDNAILHATSLHTPAQPPSRKAVAACSA
jgi:pantoate--beta-alanine ligase